ncbi:hypothetical protein L1049_023821 [Liquidambar formosana]|uniref:Uncharacterized protein n=1 Tax=Liquidambar formosana TaxID=63359 RepID=A0AAP0S0W4_LIQFO
MNEAKLFSGELVDALAQEQGIQCDPINKTINLSASANKLSNIQKEADDYAVLIMEEWDPDNLGYSMRQLGDAFFTSSKQLCMRRRQLKSEQPEAKAYTGEQLVVVIHIASLMVTKTYATEKGVVGSPAEEAGGVGAQYATCKKR